MTDEKTKLKELEEKHGGRLIEAKVLGKVYAFRAPTLEEYESAKARLIKLASDATVGPIHRETAQKTLVYPEGDAGVAQLQAMFERMPLAASRIWLSLDALVGGDLECEVSVEESAVSAVIGDTEFVFGAIDIDTLEDFQGRAGKAAAKDGKVPVVYRELAAIALTNQSKESLAKAFAMYPGASMRVGNALAVLGGADIEISVKKG